MPMYVFLLAMVVGWPTTGLAQFIDRGARVEVKKGTALCPNLSAGGAGGSLDRNRIFWHVTSSMRANGTQTVAAFTSDEVYDRKSGDTTSVETRYDEDYATFFQSASKYKGMIVMISPQDGSEQAVVGVCPKRK